MQRMFLKLLFRREGNCARKTAGEWSTRGSSAYVNMRYLYVHIVVFWTEHFSKSWLDGNFCQKTEGSKRSVCSRVGQNGYKTKKLRKLLGKALRGFPLSSLSRLTCPIQRAPTWLSSALCREILMGKQEPNTISMNLYLKYIPRPVFWG